MIKLNNPTDKEVKFMFKGKKYSIEPMSNSELLSPEVADAWIRTHMFLSLLPNGEVKESVVVESPKEEATEAPVEKSNSKKKKAVK